MKINNYVFLTLSLLFLLPVLLYFNHFSWHIVIFPFSNETKHWLVFGSIYSGTLIGLTFGVNVYLTLKIFQVNRTFQENDVVRRDVEKYRLTAKHAIEKLATYLSHVKQLKENMNQLMKWDEASYYAINESNQDFMWIAQQLFIAIVHLDTIDSQKRDSMIENNTKFTKSILHNIATLRGYKSIKIINKTQKKLIINCLDQLDDNIDKYISKAL